MAGFYISLTRPDISYVVPHLNQFLQQPRVPHYQADMHVLRYLKGTPNTGLYYPKANNLRLIAFCDADRGSCKNSARSLTWFCVFLGSSLVSWKTKKQKTLARLSAEADYRSMSATTSELEWIASLLTDFHISFPLPIPMYHDNKAAQHIVENPVP